MLKIGDVVRTLDKVGIVDGEQRGPGHHEYYNVVRLNPKGDVILQSGNGVQSVWEPRQIEVTAIGQYFNELLHEAKFHLGWDTAKCAAIVQNISPDNIINLSVLDKLRDRIHDAIQAALEVKYQEVSDGLFNSGLFDASPEAVEAAAVSFGYPPADPPTPAPAAADEDKLIVFIHEEQKVVEEIDPWAALAGTPTVDATAGISLEDLQHIQDNFRVSEGGQPMTPEQHEQFVSIFTPPMQLFLNEAQVQVKQSINEAFENARPVFQPNELIPLSELASLTGKKTDHLNKLIKRGILPEGEKKGRVRYMPAQQCYDILTQDKEKYGHWQKPAQPIKQEAPAISWDDLR